MQLNSVLAPVPHPFAAHADAKATPSAPPTPTPPWLAPSLLAADAARLGDEAAAVAKAGADWLHVDVMDGHFVPNLAFSPAVVAALRRSCALPLDVHLMLTHPRRLFDAFAEAGADMLTFHVEAEPDVHAALTQLRALGVRTGLSVRPDTPVAALQPYLDAVDLVLVMGVQPGFGGQKMLEGCFARLQELADARRRGGHAFVLQLDGGVHHGNAAAAHAAGADALVAGSAIFGASTPRDAGANADAEARYSRRIAQLRQTAQTPKG